METAGTVTVMASDGSTLTVTGISDSTEPYNWIPTNITDVIAFADALAGLADRSLTVTFNDNANEPPMASVSADVMSVLEGGVVTLDGTASDPDSDPLTYAWTSSGGGMFADDTALDTTWAAPAVDANTNIMLTLTVSDGEDTDTASVSVTVVQLNPSDVDKGAVTIAGQEAYGANTAVVITSDVDKGAVTVAGQQAYGVAESLVDADKGAVSVVGQQAYGVVTAPDEEPLAPVVVTQPKDELDLLVSQWRDKVRLVAYLQNLLDTACEGFDDPVDDLAAQFFIGHARGFMLDRIGAFLGMPRPSVSIAAGTEARFFGFEEAGLGFGAPFVPRVELAAREPMGDAQYRDWLNARIITITSVPTVVEVRAALVHIEPNASIVDNHDLTYTITTGRQAVVEQAEQHGALSKPLGVRRVFATP